MSRIDDIFSSKRLRKNWKPGSGTPEKQSEALSPPSNQGRKVFSELKRLQGLINQSFHGKQGEGLNMMIAELKDSLIMRFPESHSDEAAGNISEEDKEALNPAIEELLDQIEELVDALEIGRNSSLFAAHH